MDVNQLLSLLGRRWKLVAASVLVAVLGAAAISFLVTPEYESRARLFVTPERDAQRDPYALTLLAGQRVKTYAELATSQPVLGAVAERQDVRADVRDLRDQIKVTAVPETLVLSVVATDDSAKGAQTLARTASREVSSYLTGLETRGTSRSGLEIRVSDPASLPDSPTSPRTALNLLVAGLLGLLVGLALAVLVEHRGASDRRKGEHDEDRAGDAGRQDGDTERLPEKAVGEPSVPAARRGELSGQGQ